MSKISKISYFHEEYNNKGIERIIQTVALDDSLNVLDYQEAIIFRSKDIRNMVKIRKVQI